MQSESTLTPPEIGSTQHTMLIVWGHFAQSIGLLEQLKAVPIPQKTVIHQPTEKLTEFFISLLAGNEYLTDLSAVNDLRERNEVLLLDADLTGLPVSSSSRTYPGAAFGYMDGEIRLGHQLAQVCLQTRLFGRQWLTARHHPGNTVSCECLFELIAEAERHLGCYPRRRPDLVEQRRAACEQVLAELEGKVARQEEGIVAQLGRVESLRERLGPAQARAEALLAVPLSSRQAGRYSTLTRLQKQIVSWQGQLRWAEARFTRLRKALQGQRERAERQRGEGERLREREQRLSEENACQIDAPRCKMRLDAGFSSGENLTELIELGYEVESKSANDALVRGLRQRVGPETSWTRVGDDAEMVAWTNYHIRRCPYPLTVGLERFHTPKELRHAVLIRSQDGPQVACPDLKEWFHVYNGRQTIEAGNKEEKGTFRVQHLMSRSPSGIRIQGLLTAFAANLVRWADEWVRPRVEQSSARFAEVLSSPKRLVRVAANSPGFVDRSHGELQVQFSDLRAMNDFPSDCARLTLRHVRRNPDTELCRGLHTVAHSSTLLLRRSSRAFAISWSSLPFALDLFPHMR